MIAQQTRSGFNRILHGIERTKAIVYLCVSCFIHLIRVQVDGGTKCSWPIGRRADAALNLNALNR